MRLLWLLWRKFRQNVELFGPVIVGCIGLYEVFGLCCGFCRVLRKPNSVRIPQELVDRQPEQFEADFERSFTPLFCELSDQFKDFADEKIVHPQWLRCWYNLAKRIPSDVRLKTFESAHDKL